MMSESESMENLQSAVDKNHGTARGITAQEVWRIDPWV